MFKSLAASLNTEPIIISTKCLKHPSSEVMTFCASPECLKPLCLSCLSDHCMFHFQNKSQPVLIDYKKARDACIDRLKRVNDYVGILLTGIKRDQDSIPGNCSYQDIEIEKIRRSKEYLINFVEKYYKNLLDHYEMTSRPLETKLQKMLDEVRELHIKLDGKEYCDVLKTVNDRDFEQEIAEIRASFPGRMMNNNSKQIWSCRNNIKVDIEYKRLYTGVKDELQRYANIILQPNSQDVSCDSKLKNECRGTPLHYFDPPKLTELRPSTPLNKSLGSRDVKVSRFSPTQDNYRKSNSLDLEFNHDQLLDSFKNGCITLDDPEEFIELPEITKHDQLKIESKPKDLMCKQEIVQRLAHKLAIELPPRRNSQITDYTSVFRSSEASTSIRDDQLRDNIKIAESLLRTETVFVKEDRLNSNSGKYLQERATQEVPANNYRMFEDAYGQQLPSLTRDTNNFVNKQSIHSNNPTNQFKLALDVCQNQNEIAKGLYSQSVSHPFEQMLSQNLSLRMSDWPKSVPDVTEEDRRRESEDLFGRMSWNNLTEPDHLDEKKCQKGKRQDKQLMNVNSSKDKQSRTATNIPTPIKKRIIEDPERIIEDGQGHTVYTQGIRVVDLQVSNAKSSIQKSSVEKNDDRVTKMKISTVKKTAIFETRFFNQSLRNSAKWSIKSRDEEIRSPFKIDDITPIKVPADFDAREHLFLTPQSTMNPHLGASIGKLLDNLGMNKDDDLFIVDELEFEGKNQYSSRRKRRSEKVGPEIDEVVKRHIYIQEPCFNSQEEKQRLARGGNEQGESNHIVIEGESKMIDRLELDQFEDENDEEGDKGFINNTEYTKLIDFGRDRSVIATRNFARSRIMNFGEAKSVILNNNQKEQSVINLELDEYLFKWGQEENNDILFINDKQGIKEEFKEKETTGIFPVASSDFGDNGEALTSTPRLNFEREEDLLLTQTKNSKLVQKFSEENKPIQIKEDTTNASVALQNKTADALDNHNSLKTRLDFDHPEDLKPSLNQDEQTPHITSLEDNECLISPVPEKDFECLPEARLNSSRAHDNLNSNILVNTQKNNIKHNCSEIEIEDLGKNNPSNSQEGSKEKEATCQSIETKEAADLCINKPPCKLNNIQDSKVVLSSLKEDKILDSTLNQAADRQYSSKQRINYQSSQKKNKHDDTIDPAVLLRLQKNLSHMVDESNLLLQCSNQDIVLDSFSSKLPLNLNYLQDHNNTGQGTNGIQQMQEYCMNYDEESDLLHNLDQDVRYANELQGPSNSTINFPHLKRKLEEVARMVDLEDFSATEKAKHTIQTSEQENQKENQLRKDADKMDIIENEKAKSELQQLEDQKIAILEQKLMDRLRSNNKSITVSPSRSAMSQMDGTLTPHYYLYDPQDENDPNKSQNKRVDWNSGSSVPDFTVNLEDYFKSDAKTKLLHFFEWRSKNLHILPFEDVKVPNKKIVFQTISLNINFKIPDYHNSLITPDGDIYITGGQDGKDLQKKYKEVYRVCLEKQTLIPRASMIHRRDSHALCYHQGYLYATGGITIDDQGKKHVTSRCEKYSLAENKWEEIADLTLPVCNHSASTFQDKYIFCFGGRLQPNKLSNNIFRYSFEKNSWLQLELKMMAYNQMNLSLTSQATCFQVNEKQIFIFGGYQANRNISSQSFLFEYCSGTSGLSEIKDSCSRDEKSEDVSKSPNRDDRKKKRKSRKEKRRDVCVIKGFNKKELPHAAPFWDKQVIVDQGKMYCLQNVITANNPKLSYSTTRRVLVFDGEGWTSLN